MSKSGSGYCAISVALLSGIIALLLAGQAAAGIIFQDDFETGDLSKNQAGAHWGASNHGTTDNLRISNARAKLGQYSLEFTFHGDANIDADAWSEQRFELGGRYAEIWMKYDIYVPANYVHRKPTTGANNKSFVHLWAGDYGAGPGLGAGWESEALDDGTAFITFHNFRPDQTHRWDPIRYQRTDTRTFDLTDRGTWVEIIVQTKAASVANNDGEARVWKRPQGSSTRTLIFEQTGMNTYNAAGNFFERGYLLGWANSGYTETTVFYIDNVVISDTPIDGSGGATGGNTPPPSSSSGGDSGGGSGGGSGCGFVKEINGKGLKAKGEGLSFAIMLIIALIGITLARRIFSLKEFILYKYISVFLRNITVMCKEFGGSMDIFPTQKRTFAATHISKSRASSLCKRVVPAVAFCVLLQPLGTAIAADYYVDGNNTSASDTNPGAAASPWKTMYKAMAAPLQPGDTVHVMAGTYDASVGGTWSQPALRPSSSGAQGNPITFRAEPRQSVILDTKNTPSTPAIGVRLQNYIVIDGFVIPSAEAKGIAVFGISGAKVIGVVLQNNIVHGVWQAGVPGDNTDGIRLEYTSGTIVRNNIIYNVDNPAHSENAAGIKMYHNDTALIENNEIYNTVSGIFDKEQGDNNTFRRNYLHNVKLGIYLQSGGSGNSIVGDQMSENVINQVVQGIGILPADGTLTDNITITNNVIANYTDTGVFPASTGTFNIYNNIFHRTGSSLRGDLFTYNDPPNSIVLMDYNLFVTEPKFYIGVYLTNRVISTLHAWQNATVHDPHSNVGDAAFVGAATGDFHLKANSPAIGAGRVGGVSTGDHVNQGAYITGSEIIGPTGGIDGGGSGGGNTPPPSSSSGGDSGGGSGGGGGCGFVKDINGKGPKAKGEGLAFAVMLIITLAGIALIRRITVGLKMRRAFFALIKGLSFFVVAVLLAQIAACGSGGGGDSSNFSNNSSGGSGGDTGGGTGSGVTATLLLTTSGQYYTLPDDLTTAGTAVSISANDVTLDLNGKTITYNASSSGSRVYGVYVAVGVSRVTVKNGTILQGAGNTADSPAIYIYGASWASGHTISDMVIRVTGFQTNGIQADNGYGFNNSQIYRTYVELHGDTTAMDGYGGDPITVCATNTGGIQIHDNVLVAGHRGIQACSVGTSQANPSAVYNNRIQQVRRMGSKAPYGILLDGKSHNVAIHDNQIVSDDGRGINLDGWGQNNTEGTSNNHVYNNRIDVQYSTTATNGAYVENNLYGIRDRYASGDNLIEYNTVLVASNIQGDIYGMYIGSDGADPGMKNIVVRNNTIIARRGTVPTDTPYVFCFDYADSITATNNSYITHGGFNETSLCHNAVNPLIVSGNTVLSPPATISPAAPTSVQITHFLDSYMITWNANSEADVYEYVVYRDGVKLPISPRGGTFYVDVGINGTHNYSVSALTLTGVEGAQSVSVSTNTAKNGWW